MEKETVNGKKVTKFSKKIIIINLQYNVGISNTQEKRKKESYLREDKVGYKGRCQR